MLTLRGHHCRRNSSTSCAARCRSVRRHNPASSRAWSCRSKGSASSAGFRAFSHCPYKATSASIVGPLRRSHGPRNASGCQPWADAFTGRLGWRPPGQPCPRTGAMMRAAGASAMAALRFRRQARNHSLTPAHRFASPEHPMIPRPQSRLDPVRHPQTRVDLREVSLTVFSLTPSRLAADDSADLQRPTTAPLAVLTVRSEASGTLLGLRASSTVRATWASIGDPRQLPPECQSARVCGSASFIR